MASITALPPEVFLDTSIVLARLKGAQLKDRVDGTLSRFRWRGTGSYAKLEYGNRVLSIAAYLLDKLKALGSLEALRYHIQNRLNPRIADHRHKMLWFGNLLSQHFNLREATERAERGLRHLLRVGTTVVSALCDETVDEIGCVWADQDVSRRRWVTPRGCDRRRAVCGIGRFFGANQTLFEAIRDAIRGAPNWQVTDELLSFAGVIDEACRDPQVLRQDGKCRRLADAIIAVQSRRYRAFFTQNLRESIVLCPVMQQVLLYLAQDPLLDVVAHDFRPEQREA